MEGHLVRGQLREVPPERLAVEVVAGMDTGAANRLAQTLARLSRSNKYDYIFVELLGDDNPLHAARDLFSLQDAGVPLTDLLRVRFVGDD